jgi:cell division protein FtsB
MNAYYTSALVCGIIIAVLFAVLVALEIIRVYRTQINTDLAEDNRRLRMEIAYTRAKHADAVNECSVHYHTIKTLNKRVERLEHENEELKAGHPVVTGYTFVK